MTTKDETVGTNPPRHQDQTHIPHELSLLVPWELRAPVLGSQSSNEGKQGVSRGVFSKKKGSLLRPLWDMV